LQICGDGELQIAGRLNCLAKQLMPFPSNSRAEEQIGRVSDLSAAASRDEHSLTAGVIEQLALPRYEKPVTDQR